MMKILTGVVLACFCWSFIGCLNDDAGGQNPLPDADTISVVDSLGHPLSATSVMWWYAEESEDTSHFSATCVDAECSIWTVPADVQGSILIQGVLDFQPQDEACWAEGSAVQSFEADSTVSQSVDLVIADLSITCQ